MYYNVICQIYTKLLQNPSINKIVKDIHRFHHKHHHQRSVCKVPPGCPGAAKLPPFAAPPGEPLNIIYDISSLYLYLFIYYEIYIYLWHHRVHLHIQYMIYHLYIFIFLYIMNYTYICGTTRCTFISSLYLYLFIYYELYKYLRHHWVHFPTLLI